MMLVDPKAETICSICKKVLVRTPMGIRSHLNTHVRRKELRKEDLFSVKDAVLSSSPINKKYWKKRKKKDG